MKGLGTERWREQQRGRSEIVKSNFPRDVWSSSGLRLRVTITVELRVRWLGYEGADGVTHAKALRKGNEYNENAQPAILDLGYEKV